MAWVRLQDFVAHQSNSGGLFTVDMKLPVRRGSIPLSRAALAQVRAWMKEPPTLAQVIATGFDVPEWGMDASGWIHGCHGIYETRDRRKSTGCRYESKWAIELDARAVLAKAHIVEVFLFASLRFMPHGSRLDKDKVRVRAFMAAVFGKNYRKKLESALAHPAGFARSRKTLKMAKQFLASVTETKSNA